jgi:hypothetical protein
MLMKLNPILTNILGRVMRKSYGRLQTGSGVISMSRCGCMRDPGVKCPLSVIEFVTTMLMMKVHHGMTDEAFDTVPSLLLNLSA